MVVISVLVVAPFLGFGNQQRASGGLMTWGVDAWSPPIALLIQQQQRQRQRHSQALWLQKSSFSSTVDLSKEADADGNNNKNNPLSLSDMLNDLNQAQVRYAPTSTKNELQRLWEQHCRPQKKLQETVKATFSSVSAAAVDAKENALDSLSLPELLQQLQSARIRFPPTASRAELEELWLQHQKNGRQQEREHGAQRQETSSVSLKKEATAAWSSQLENSNDDNNNREHAQQQQQPTAVETSDSINNSKEEGSKEQQDNDMLEEQEEEEEEDHRVLVPELVDDKAYYGDYLRRGGVVQPPRRRRPSGRQVGTSRQRQPRAEAAHHDIEDGDSYNNNNKEEEELLLRAMARQRRRQQRAEASTFRPNEQPQQRGQGGKEQLRGVVSRAGDATYRAARQGWQRAQEWWTVHPETGIRTVSVIDDGSPPRKRLSPQSPQHQTRQRQPQQPGPTPSRGQSRRPQRPRRRNQAGYNNNNNDDDGGEIPSNERTYRVRPIITPPPPSEYGYKKTVAPARSQQPRRRRRNRSSQPPPPPPRTIRPLPLPAAFVEAGDEEQQEAVSARSRYDDDSFKESHAGPHRGRTTSSRRPDSQSRYRSSTNKHFDESKRIFSPYIGEDGGGGIDLDAMTPMSVASAYFDDNNEIDEEYMRDAVDRLGDLFANAADYVMFGRYEKKKQRRPPPYASPEEDVQPQAHEAATTTTPQQQASEQADSQYQQEPQDQQHHREPSRPRPASRPEASSPHWKDRLEERLDSVLGIHEDGSFYNSWMEKEEQEQEAYGRHATGQRYGAAQGQYRPPPRYRRREPGGYSSSGNGGVPKPLWSDFNAENIARSPGFLTSFLFGRDRRSRQGGLHHNNNGSNHRGHGEPLGVLNNVNGGTSEGSLLNVLSVAGRMGNSLCQWASVRGAVPPSMVALVVGAAAICTRQRFRAMIVALLAVRTFGEVMVAQGYYWLEDDDENDNEHGEGDFNGRAVYDDNYNLGGWNQHQRREEIHRSPAQATSKQEMHPDNFGQQQQR